MKLTCLVDNAVKPGSDLWGEHGLAFLVEGLSGCLLFDTGASFTVLAHNLAALDIPVESITALALSHGHRDHTGGLESFLALRGRLPTYIAHPDLLAKRYSCQTRRTESIGLPFEPRLLQERAELCVSSEPRQVLSGIWTTGEIGNRPEPEGRSPGHYLSQNGELVPDPYRDDMGLVLEGSSGLALLCGCSHAGLLNVLLHVRSAFGQAPTTIIGGLHLLPSSSGDLASLIGALRRFGTPALYPNHCTGTRAFLALAQAFPERVIPCPAGMVLEP